VRWRTHGEKANNGFESASRGTKTPLQHREFDAWAHQQQIQLRFDPPDEPTRTHMLTAFTSALAEVPGMRARAGEKTGHAGLA
jgi:hypothetical protein